MWNLKHGTNELIYRTETDSENRLVVAKEEGGRRETERTREKEAEREKVTRKRREGQKRKLL